MKALEFKVGLSVIDHLGSGLYSKTPAVMTEIIANAWDADAENVWITLDADKDLIIVEDDGQGMTRADVQKKFLNVGYRRRDVSGSKSDVKKRHVMGRKGIGKLAMFSLADSIQLVTKTKRSDVVACEIDVVELRKRIARDKTYSLRTPPTFENLRGQHGTRITLRALNNKINKDQAYVVRNLARRFSILGDLHKFHLEVNGHEITREDRAFYGDVQFLWYFDDETLDETRPLLTNLASIDTKKKGKKVTTECSESLPSSFPVGRRALHVTGYIASVDKPVKLGKGDESINLISVFANGRVFEEDVLADLGSARVFNSYVVGEVHADFLDRDSVDRATASREAIKHDDELYQGLRAHLKVCLTQIRDQWDKWRQALGYEKTGDAVPEIRAWIDGLADPRDRKTADRLMTSIANLSIADDEGRDRAGKMQLYRSTIVAFEKLRLRNRLDELEGITDVTSPEFRAIFTTIDDVEESSFFEITRARLGIIRRFDEEIVSPRKLEKIAQEYLFDHLWLLDPSWDRISGIAEKEQLLTAELKKVSPESKKGARLDIAYRTSAGRHAIIELKRPGLKPLDLDDLQAQGKRYRKAMEQYLTDHPDLYGPRLPVIDVYLLIEERPRMDEKDERALEILSIKILTYRGLIENAKAIYADYLQQKRVLGTLEKTLKALK